MAIYHLEAKVVSRGTGRSACAAAAYMSCSRILNEYDGVQHDYTRKRGLVAHQVFLPAMAPPEWQDREKLWNAVEAAEKTKDSRLAREFVVALPVEMDKAGWVRLLTEFIQTQFVNQGMCADAAIHDTDGHNPHAHILLTVRPLNPDGTWQQKTEKEYLCVKDGEERGFTAAEFLTAQKEGWEKQYPYKVGKKKVYMTPSAAEAQGLERASKYPKSTKFGRQNPISARWNSEEQLVAWRAAWADHVNRSLEEAGLSERIDHRSFADQGKEEQPTIHEGVIARSMEQKGFTSDRCALNRQIKRDNALLRALKTAVTKLTDAIRHSIPAVAELLESIRFRLIVLRYSVMHAAAMKRKVESYLTEAKPALASYQELAAAIQSKAKERKGLLVERDALPVIAVFKKRELTARIEGLTEEIEELKSEETAILRRFRKDAAVRQMAAEPKKRAAISQQARKEIAQEINSVEEQAHRHADREAAFEAQYIAERERFLDARDETQDLDLYDLTAARLKLRPNKEQAAFEEIRSTFSKKASIFDRQKAIKDIDYELNEEHLEKWLCANHKTCKVISQYYEQQCGSNSISSRTHDER